MKLVVVRHGESKWNYSNQFTGWCDVDLSFTGCIEARKAGRILKSEGYDFDICYTSYLKRAIYTLNLILEEMDREWLPVVKTYKLNERHYGALQGLNKIDTARKFGEEQVQKWRRSYSVKPPVLDKASPYNPRKQLQYRGINLQELPLCESLDDTIKRVVPYFNDVIKPQMLEGKKVLIAAHGNSIRSIVKYLENLTQDEIVNVNIPTGIPLVYELDDNFKVINKYYLGDQSEIKNKIDSVSAQGVIKSNKVMRA